MANYNEHKCLACGQIFDYCRRCVITPVVYKAEGFCSEKCSNIHATLSKHGCNLISADEALVELSAYNLDELTLNDNILSHIEILKSEVEANPMDVASPVETVVEDIIKTPKVNFNNKKKW